MTGLLQLDGVEVSYGNVQALRGVSLRVDEGEMVALLGPNGAGKTTTLRAVSGLVPLEAGSVTFAGERIDGVPAHELAGRGISHLPEGRDLFPSLTVEENLRYGWWSRRRRDGRAAYQARLERVYGWFPDLASRRSQVVATLSGGEQQMLALGRALMPSPRLLVVDELSLGLAPKVVESLFATLREVNAEGTAMLLVEQFVHLVLANTSRGYVLGRGEVVMEKPSNELAHDPQLIASYLGTEQGLSASVSASDREPDPEPPDEGPPPPPPSPLRPRRPRTSA